MAEVTQSTEQKANYNWIQDWSASHAQRKRQKALSDKRKRANDILAEKEYAKSASEAQYAYDNARNNASNNRRLAEAEAAGFNKKGINYIIRQRKKDRDQIAEEKELFDTYAKAAGL